MSSQSDLILLTANFVEQVHGSLIVSCQALPHEPLFGAEVMAKMALAAAQGGAKAIRANTPVDIVAIRKTIALPIIGLWKVDFPGYPVYITPTIEQAKAVAKAGADIIAIDATDRARPQPGNLADFIQLIHQETGKLVLADVSTHEEGVAAETAGADMVSTTMSGYTEYSSRLDGPDLELVRSLVEVLKVPLFAEGRYRTPQQVSEALGFGATAVIVGGAITRPLEITKWFIAETEKEILLAKFAKG